MGVSFFIDFPIPPFKIVVPESNFLLVGSCFSEHIGNKLLGAGFETMINPFGILYNSSSLAESIRRIATRELYTEADLLKNHEGRFVSFDHHGRFSGSDASEVLASINNSLSRAHEFIKKATCTVITLGSAWVYKLAPENRIVANCHKFPASRFEKILLPLDEVVAHLKNIHQSIRAVNPGAEIIWTISPVKHLRDGVVENQQSKSVLISALHEHRASVENPGHYFPAYEIVNDELRDYRFFDSDHAHPNALAIDYVWERFLQTCFTAAALEKVSLSDKLARGLNHRSLHSESPSPNLHERILHYLEKYPLPE